jgi:imidazole glycerol-phosphate synthase subunit HisH
MITIIDYGRGNLFSISQAFNQIGAESEITDDPARIAGANSLVLPGVGAFHDAMESLRQLGMVEPIIAAATAGVPIFGICLGMQLLADNSAEFGSHQGLGLIAGRVHRLPNSTKDQTLMKVPNVGWREVDFSSDAHAFVSGDANPIFYFVHSYAFDPADPSSVAATTSFGERDITAMVRQDNVMGCQFHPEKSGDAGLNLLSCFAAGF